MKERPILFSGPMVRAILAGTKTQTRRIVDLARARPRPDSERGSSPPPDGAMLMARITCPYGVPGDRLWVRETWAGDDLCGYVYRADHPDADLRRGDLDDGEQAIRAWRPSIFMQRAASRIELEVTAVRIEHLQSITEDDARAEGVDITEPRLVGGALASMSRRENFESLWYDIHGATGPKSWSRNPWVWVVSFKRVRP